MHSEIPENLIQQALKIHKENSRLVRLAAPPADVNFCDQWFQLQTQPEYARLFAQLSLVTGRGFPRWWLDIFDEFVNNKRITEIRNIFDMPIVGSSDTLFEFGKDDRYSTYPYDPTHPNGIQPAIWDKISDNLTLLCQYLYVYIFRSPMAGDRRRYTSFLATYSAPSSSSSGSITGDRSERINTEKLIENSIPPRLLEPYSVTTASTPTVDSYTYIKSETTKFFVRCFTFDNPGKVARYQFFKRTDINKFDFDEYWASLPGFYSSVSDINSALNASLPISSGTATLLDLGTASGTDAVDKDEIKKALDNLINKIREHEVEEIIKIWVKMYSTVGKIANPFFKAYELSQNLMGAAGSLGDQRRR